MPKSLTTYYVELATESLPLLQRDSVRKKAADNPVLRNILRTKGHMIAARLERETQSEADRAEQEELDRILSAADADRASRYEHASQVLRDTHQWMRENDG